MLNQYSKLFLQLCKPVANIIFTLIKKALAPDGLSGHENNLEFNLAFYMIPGIPGITSLKFPFPSLSVAICEFPFPSCKTGMWFSIPTAVPRSQKVLPAHPWYHATSSTVSLWLIWLSSRTFLTEFVLHSWSSLHHHHCVGVLLLGSNLAEQWKAIGSQWLIGNISIR